MLRLFYVLVILVAGGITWRVLAPRLADLLVSAARADADEGNVPGALRRLAFARWFDRGPTAAMEQALLLEQLGDPESAIRAYGWASRRSQDGWADLQAALLLVRSHRMDEAAERLGVAFGRSPFLAEEAECFPELRPLLWDPRFSRFRQGP